MQLSLILLMNYYSLDICFELLYKNFKNLSRAYHPYLHSDKFLLTISNLKVIILSQMLQKKGQFMSQFLFLNLKQIIYP